MNGWMAERRYEWMNKCIYPSIDFSTVAPNSGAPGAPGGRRKPKLVKKFIAGDWTERLGVSDHFKAKFEVSDDELSKIIMEKF